MVVDLMDPATYEAWESHRESETKNIESEAMEVDDQPQQNTATVQNAGGADGAAAPVPAPIGVQGDQDGNDVAVQAPIRRVYLPC